MHVVQRGETLYKIAWQYRVDQQELASWNGIRNPDELRVGQRLRLVPPRGYVAAAPAPAARPPPSARRRRRRATPPRPSTTLAAHPRPLRRPARRRRRRPAARAPAPATALRWSWPTDGRVVTRFGADDGIASGIGIGGREGQPVRAAAAGPVVYAGGGLIGYGQLVIIKHNETSERVRLQPELLVTQGQGRHARRDDRARWGKARAASRGCISRSAATACPSIRCCSCKRRPRKDALRTDLFNPRPTAKLSERSAARMK